MQALLHSLCEHLAMRVWVMLNLDAEPVSVFLLRGSGCCPQARLELCLSQDAIVISIAVEMQRVAPFEASQVVPLQ